MSALPTEEIERIVTAGLTGDRAAESRMLEALRPGVLAVLRFGAFHRWIDQEDLTQETLHIVVERVRAMAKRSAPDRIPVRLTNLVHEVVALTRAESAARRVAIRTDVPADLPLVLGDRVQLQQVLLNLVVNAMDAMSGADEQDRSLDIRGRVDMDDGCPAVTIGVEDRGVGLQPDELERLFEAFYTTKPHGMGLGLAISRSIIEAHGGRLRGESNRGRGAVFSFRLPAAQTSRAA